MLLGQTADFTCEGTVDNGTITITWLKNGRMPSNHHWHPNDTRLRVTNARVNKDCANITCVAESGGYRVTSSATLTVISECQNCDV